VDPSLLLGCARSFSCCCRCVCVCFFFFLLLDLLVSLLGWFFLLLLLFLLTRSDPYRSISPFANAHLFYCFSPVLGGWLLCILVVHHSLCCFLPSSSSVDQVDRAMDDIQESFDVQRELGDALSQGFSSDLYDDVRSPSCLCVCVCVCVCVCLCLCL
jgi:hypothetical protein